VSPIPALVLALAMAPAAPRKPLLPGDRMVQAGVGVVVGGVAAYALFAVGLAMGNNAESQLPPLREREDIDHRRDVLARGKLGNQLAIAGGVLSAVAIGVGIPLIVIGRRRHIAAVKAGVAWIPGGSKAMISVRF
jgi:hypothetical protein